MKLLSNLQFDGSHLSFDYATAEPGFLLWIDNWDESWSATVNGRSVPMLQAFGTFKAVPIASGRHHVEFRYRPSFPRPWLTPLGFVFVVVVAVVERKRGDRHPGEPATSQREGFDAPASDAGLTTR